MENRNNTLSLFEETENMEVKSPFINRKVVIEGTFHSINKNTLKTSIKRLGGEIVSGDVTKNVHFFIVGDNVSADKMEKYDKLCFNGYHIKTLSESDILNILNGDVEKYIVPYENIKDLRMTIDHYNRKHVIYKGKITEPSGREYIPNPIYGKNLFLGQGITGKKCFCNKCLAWSVYSVARD